MNGDWFASRLRELREAAGLTQPQLAERAGMTRDGISHLEQGRRKPSWETVLALCAALGVDCTAFTQEPAKREPQGPGRPASKPALERFTPADDEAAAQGAVNANKRRRRPAPEKKPGKKRRK